MRATILRVFVATPISVRAAVRLGRPVLTAPDAKDVFDLFDPELDDVGRIVPELGELGAQRSSTGMNTPHRRTTRTARRSPP